MAAAVALVEVLVVAEAEDVVEVVVILGTAPRRILPLMGLNSPLQQHLSPKMTEGLTAANTVVTVSSVDLPTMLATTTSSAHFADRPRLGSW
jgi:hypothetical protein